MELSKYMAEILDEEWKAMRGMEVCAVGIASVSYDEESTKLINLRNQGAMLSDPSVREGYVQGSVARGIEAAGSNANGSMAAFMGMGMGMNTAGGYMAGASETNMRQMEANHQNQQQASAGVDTWKCECGSENTGKFCSECGKEKKEETVWTCGCGHVNTGKFCSECGKQKVREVVCNKCGYVYENLDKIPKFCPECGDEINEEDFK